MNKAKLIVLRVVFLILLIITCVTIFEFSAQEVTESDGTSRRVLAKIIDIVFKDINQEEKHQLIDQWNIFIRKLAHFSIYTLVGIWSMAFISTFNIGKYKSTGISLIVGILYASSDEYHQSFVPGRGPSIIDVGIDSLGVFTGICIVLIIIFIYKTLKKHKKNAKK